MIVAVFVVTEVAAHHFYSTFPITLKGYTGDKTNSVSYSGQIARHVLHDSLKKLAGKGDGGSNAAEIEAQMMKYFKGSKEDLDICLLYTSPSPRDGLLSRMPSSA